MAGCAHPGIVNIVRRAKEIVNKDIYLVFGGFHLINYSEAQINNIIGEFREMGVQKCGATHCTGENQIEMLRKAFGASARLAALPIREEARSMTWVACV